MEQGLGDALAAITGVGAAMAALGAGVGPGVPSVVNATPDEVRQALASSPELRRVAQIAGRLRIAARKAQRERVVYLPEQVVDITLGGELSRVLPAELMRLADPTGELDLARKLIERQALEYKLEGTEAQDKGPLILAVDASGSMQGTRYEWAMGVALALIEICMKDRRPFMFFAYDHTPGKTYRFDDPRSVTLDAVMGMLQEYTGGGTNIAAAINWASGLVQKGDEKWERADLILVSDGDDSGYGDRIRQLKADQGIDTYGVAIQSDFEEAEAEVMAGVVSVTGDQIAEGTADVQVVFGI